MLNSLDLGMSWYTSDLTATATITLVNGSTINEPVTITRDFTTFTFGLAATSVTISSPELSDGYLALDNVNVNAVPETGTALAGFLGLGLGIGLTVSRRKA